MLWQILRFLKSSCQKFCCLIFTMVILFSYALNLFFSQNLFERKKDPQETFQINWEAILSPYAPLISKHNKKFKINWEWFWVQIKLAEREMSCSSFWWAEDCPASWIIKDKILITSWIGTGNHREYLYRVFTLRELLRYIEGDKIKGTHESKWITGKQFLVHNEMKRCSS